MRKCIPIIVTSLGVAALTTCGETTTPDDELANISITLPSSTIYVGATTQCTAQLCNHAGDVLTGRDGTSRGAVPIRRSPA